jgi:hypothetical protein
MHQELDIMIGVLGSYTGNWVEHKRSKMVLDHLSSFPVHLPTLTGINIDLKMHHGCDLLISERTHPEFSKKIRHFKTCDCHSHSSSHPHSWKQVGGTNKILANNK